MSRLCCWLVLLLIPASLAGQRPTETEPRRRTPLEDRAIEVTLRRLSGTTGQALVSNGVPLPPSWLRADDLDRVRLLIQGEEQPLAVAALAGTHPDGSLRSILIQTRYPLSSRKAVPGTLEVGGRSRRQSLPLTRVTWSVPEAVALPSSAAYLVTTGLVGPTVPVREAPRRPRYFRQYEADFIRFSDRHWKQEGRKWDGNYYDRVLSHYAFWARTADPTYWERATEIAADYRAKYIEANDYKPSPHWTQIDGLALHYWLTGDERSRTAVANIARTLHDGFGGKRLNEKDHGWMDSRIQARVLTSKLRAWQLDTKAPGARTWPALLHADLDRILDSQRPDGSYRWKSQCYESSNFMAGLLNEALIRYYTWFEPDRRIPGSVRKALDYLWTQWRADDQAFAYYSGECPGHGGRGAAADLSMLIVNGFGWYYHLTGDRTYLLRGDRVFAGAVGKAYLSGSKQFNQQYASSYQYLALRRRAPVPERGLSPRRAPSDSLASAD